MKKSKQVVKTETKKEKIPVKNVELEKGVDFLDINDDDLEPSSDTLDFKNLLTQSYDLSKTLASNVSQVKSSQLGDLFLLDTNKLGQSLKCNAFYKNFDQDLVLKNYFDQHLIELFDKKENENRVKFEGLYHRDSMDRVELKETHEKKTIEHEKKNKEEIVLKPVETKTQNIDDWLDELID